LSPIREESTSVQSSPDNRNEQQQQQQWNIENGGLSPTDVKDDSQLLMNPSSLKRSHPSIGINQDNHDDETSRNTKANDLQCHDQNQTSNNDETARPAGRRKSRLAKLVEARKQKRRAQKVTEKDIHNGLKIVDDKNQGDVNKKGSEEESSKGMESEMDRTGTGSCNVKIDSGTPKLDDTYYDDNEVSENRRKDECECSVCVVM
jgi:cytochrome c553